MSDKTSEALKSCPFCGGKAELHKGFLDFENFVACSKCRCSTELQNTERKAIEAWNNRNPVDAVLKHLESIRNIELIQIGGRCNGKTLKTGYLKGIANAIRIIKEGLA